MINKTALLLLVSLSAVVTSKPRIDCHPDINASMDECQHRGCIWEEGNADANEPWCYFNDTTGYIVKQSNASSFILTPYEKSRNPFSDNLKQVQVTIKAIGSTLNIKIFDSDSERYEVPLELPGKKMPSKAPSESDMLQFASSTDPDSKFSFTVTVRRDNKNVTVWDTSIGGFLFGDQYIQIATYLPTKNIYGFGEHVHKRIKHNLNRYTKWAMFTRDIGPNSKADLSTTNLYGVHPFYLALEESGTAHGVFILNSNAQEVELGTGPHLTYRTIGGILDIYFFPGPTPEAVIQQYHAFIGKPMFPAYWGLGFHLCRWGYENLTAMELAVGRTRSNGVPLEVVIADIDYMDKYQDFTVGWEGLKNYTDELHNDGMHLTLIIDAGVPVSGEAFRRGIEKNVTFIKWPEEKFVQHGIVEKYPYVTDELIMLGNVWPDNHTAMPDFLDPELNTENWWIDEFIRLRQITGMDSIWLDMNEPSNFDTDPMTNLVTTIQKRATNEHLKCPVSGTDGKYDEPPYPTAAKYNFGNDAYLFSKTSCMIGKTGRGKYRFYDTHSIWSTAQIMATAKAQKKFGNRGAMISRSTYASAGHYMGHWLGDNSAQWEDLQTSVIGAQEFNLFGMTYVGSDICGFFGNTTEELCLRWHQMGAFHTYSRNHNQEGMILQDPGIWPSVARAAKESLLFKYNYLPYLYTLMYEASINGGTVIRPLFFEFPNDEQTYDLGYQFMWGSAMMFMPVVYENVTQIGGYLPPSATWYSLRDYGKLQILDRAQAYSAKLDELIPIFARAGYIIPKQQPEVVIKNMRDHPFTLLIIPESNKAKGTLFWDDGESYLDNNFYYYSFEYTNNGNDHILSWNRKNIPENANVTFPGIGAIEIFGYPCAPTIRGFEKETGNTQMTVNYDTDSKALRIAVPNPFNMFLSKDSIKWQMTWYN
uniref:P-type domain-containing protein n=1 Tax=Syphacia muris TaxID=451379 RepID=A0A0N5AG59_9BILA